MTGVGRREFIKRAGAGAGLLLAGTDPLRAAPAVSRRAGDVVVVGAGAFGGWTALHLQRLGARVTLMDTYGPGNSRATSGGETRGVRSSYGDRPHGLLWGRWAREAIRRWNAWDEEWGARLLPRLFFTTGDVIMRAEWEPFLQDTRANWDALEVPYEVLTADEVRYRWPVIDVTDIEAVLYEPDAGVVRARRTCEAVARVFEEEGGTIGIARVSPGRRTGRRLDDVVLSPGETATAEQYVFACGPWLPKVFPEVMGNRLRTPMGYTFYYGPEPGDNRFAFPNLPSYNFPGITGWPALPPDHRGFRVRTGGTAPADPDLTTRWVPPDSLDRPRDFLAERFPQLREAPLIETRACHYESSVDRNFIVDRHPDFDNVWIAGGGSAEGFKFGPVVGEYVARRVLGLDDDVELAAQFALKEDVFEAAG